MYTYIFLPISFVTGILLLFSFVKIELVKIATYLTFIRLLLPQFNIAEDRESYGQSNWQFGAILNSVDAFAALLIIINYTETFVIPVNMVCVGYIFVANYYGSSGKETDFEKNSIL